MGKRAKGQRPSRATWVPPDAVTLGGSRGKLHPAIEGQRWVWHTQPRFILPVWEHASAGTAQRYVCLAQTRRTARTWQLNTGAAAMRTRCPHSHDRRRRNRGTCRQQSQLRRLGAERALCDRSPDQRSIRSASTKHLYRSGSSSAGDHILFLTSDTTPNLRHQGSGGTVSITSSVAILNDTTWSTIVGTWRPGRLELYVDGFSRASSTAAATNSSALFGIYRWGWGFSTSQDFNGDIALIACFGSSWTPAMVRRWHADPFGFLRPWNEVPALKGSAPPATPPSTGTGVVTFLTG
jgi:hypothetical protein